MIYHSQIHKIRRGKVSASINRTKGRLSIKEDWPVPSDSIAKIVASGLLAAVTIDIEDDVTVTVDDGCTLLAIDI